MSGQHHATGASGRRAVLLDAGASGPRAREGGALAGSLSARGFSVERFADPRACLLALPTNPADVLIIDADSPALDLRDFVETLRGDPRTARTLIVALASGDPRELPARREIALTLAKPINADEAASRLEGLVVTRQSAATNARELKGDLAQITLPDLVQLLSVNRASGMLLVDAPGRSGQLKLDAGELRGITCGPAKGLKALVRLLQLTEGHFVFTYGTVENLGDVLHLGPMLFEATRHVDEITRLRASLPEPWVQVRRAPALEEDAHSAEPFAKARGALAKGPSKDDDDERNPTVDANAREEVARLLETPRTLGALLDASIFPDADVLNALDQLRRAGLIEMAGGVASDRVDVLENAYAAALVTRLAEFGRTLTRILLVVDGTVADATLLRALSGITGFVAAEAALAGPVPLGSLGSLSIGGSRVELYAVPAERDLSPLWSVFAASSEAAVVLARSGDGARERDMLAHDLGLVSDVARPPFTPQSVADGLRGALEKMMPRR